MTLKEAPQGHYPYPNPFLDSDSGEFQPKSDRPCLQFIPAAMPYAATKDSDDNPLDVSAAHFLCDETDLSISARLNSRSSTVTLLYVLTSLLQRRILTALEDRLNRLLE